MNSPLLSVSELGSLQEIAQAGMQTTVELLRLVNSENAVGSESNWTPNGTVGGWVHSTPTPVMTIVSGGQVLVNTYRLFLPVGTDILTGDRVHIGAELYTVSDTDAESTWLPMLSVSLRKVE